MGNKQYPNCHAGNCSNPDHLDEVDEIKEMKFWIVDWDRDLYLVAAPSGALAVKEVVDQLDVDEKARIKVKQYLPTKPVLVAGPDGLEI